MGYKNTCFHCRKAFSAGNDFTKFHEAKCPECGSVMTLMSHRFRPPKKTEEQKWKTAQFLVENGFPYQHVSEKTEIGTYRHVDYPENLKEAKEFVQKYRLQAFKNKEDYQDRF